MARKNALIAVSSNETGTELTFTVGNGAGSFTLDLTALADDIRDHALRHGLVQKISDAAAIAKPELPTDPNEAALVKFAAMQSVAERLMAGDWSKRSGDGAGPVAGLIYRAFEQWVADMAKKAKKDAPSSEAIRAVYDAKTRAEQLALRNVPAIGAIIERMKSERGTTASAVDTSSLLGELGI